MNAIILPDGTTADYAPDWAPEDLNRWLKRWDRWVNYTGSEVRRMPSKASKHHAYWAASVIVQFLGAEFVGIRRATSVDELRIVAAAWARWEATR